MRRHIAKGNIRPKISTMPRQKSEAAAFLDIYKLVIEKKRLQDELQAIEERRQQIQNRIGVIDRHVADLEGSVQKMREAGVVDPNLPKLKAQLSNLSSEAFETLFLEY